MNIELPHSSFHNPYSPLFRGNGHGYRHCLARTAVPTPKIGFLSTTEAFVLSMPLMAGKSMRRTSASISPLPSAGADDGMLDTYDALASRLIDRYEREAKSGALRNGQLFVCVAGGPGSGKSTLSEAVAERISKWMGRGGGSSPSAVVLPMDGFHYTRAQLRTIGDSPRNLHTFEDLIARRGAPWTFDAEACVEAFSRARLDGEASLPVYCRARSDPVANGVRLRRETKIVLLEGNYLLAWGDARWAPLCGVFDESWYVACKSLDEQRQRLIKRHLETWSEEKTKMFGEGARGAGAKADSNDMLNLVWIDMMSRQHADVLIESL